MYTTSERVGLRERKERDAYQNVGRGGCSERVSQVLLAAFQLHVCFRGGGDLLEALELLEVTALAGDCLDLVNARTRATRLKNDATQ